MIRTARVNIETELSQQEFEDWLLKTLKQVSSYPSITSLESKQMPDGYVVLNGDGGHEYSAEERDYCNDHINDCALTRHVEGWVIRGFKFIKK